jgi:hypothetical protein
VPARPSIKVNEVLTVLDDAVLAATGTDDDEPAAVARYNQAIILGLPIEVAVADWNAWIDRQEKRAA